MELSSISSCLVTTTLIDQLGTLQHGKQHHTRVTRSSIKRLLRAELADAPLGHTAISTCASLTRIDDFLGIEVIQQDGSVEELGIIELQRSLVRQLRRLGGGVLPGPNPRAFESARRPMTRTSHGAMIERMELGDGASANIGAAFAVARDALARSLDLQPTAAQLGVQWTKSKMLDIRSDANPAYLNAESLRAGARPEGDGLAQ